MENIAARKPSIFGLLDNREPCAPFFFGSEESVQFMKTRNIPNNISRRSQLALDVFLDFLSPVG